MGERLGIGQIVDGDEFKVLISERRAQNVATDTSESINTYFYGHVASRIKFDCDRENRGNQTNI
jgi:hypothetical protein